MVMSPMATVRLERCSALSDAVEEVLDSYSGRVASTAFDQAQKRLEKRCQELEKKADAWSFFRVRMYG